MAVRTTSDAVKAIIAVDASISLTPFIEVASALVTEKCAEAVDSDGDAYHDDTRLELIERWLAAHFYAQRDPRAEQERAGSVGASYQSRVEVGFDNTHYGQMAMRLDTSGSLAALNKQIKDGTATVTVGATWIGFTPSEVPTGILD